jgi:5-methylcytosine-specific restriction endonuclease McrA
MPSTKDRTEYMAAYHRANAEAIKARKAENRESARIAEMKYYESHKEKFRAAWRKRKAAKLNNGFEPYTEQEVLDTYGSNCHLCSEPINLEAPRKSGHEGWEQGLHIDHFISLKDGGADSLNNVRPSHGVCNLRKGSTSNSSIPQAGE